MKIKFLLKEIDRIDKIGSKKWLNKQLAKAIVKNILMTLQEY